MKIAKNKLEHALLKVKPAPEAKLKPTADDIFSRYYNGHNWSAHVASCATKASVSGAHGAWAIFVCVVGTLPLMYQDSRLDELMNELELTQEEKETVRSFCGLMIDKIYSGNGLRKPAVRKNLTKRLYDQIQSIM